MPIPVIALVALGGVALMAASGRGGGGGLRLFDGQCRVIKREVTNDQQLFKLAQRIATLVDRAVSDVGGASGMAPAGEALQAILGDAPGNRDHNMAFARAVGTRVLQLSATPACLKKLDIPAGAGAQNPWGEDWYGLDLPPDMEEMRSGIAMALSQTMAEHGYDVGMEYMQTGPFAPYLAMAERIAR